MSAPLARGTKVIEIHAISELDRRALRLALDFLARHLSWVHAHLARVTDRIVVSSAPCPTAWGCVNDRAPFTIYVARAPHAIAVRELILTIAHEAWHVDLDEHGRWYVRHKHTCRADACSLPHERAMDPVYIFEDAIRPLVVEGLAREGIHGDTVAPVYEPTSQPTVSSPWPVVGAALLAAIGGFAIGTAVASK